MKLDKNEMREYEKAICPNCKKQAVYVINEKFIEDKSYREDHKIELELHCDCGNVINDIFDYEFLLYVHGTDYQVSDMSDYFDC